MAIIVGEIQHLTVHLLNIVTMIRKRAESASAAMGAFSFHLELGISCCISWAIFQNTTVH